MFLADPVQQTQLFFLEMLAVHTTTVEININL